MTTEPYTPADRRPIASRKHAVWVATANWMAARGISPNAISVAGMLCAIGAGLAAFATSYAQGLSVRVLWIGVAAGVQLRLLANMLDGMVAIQAQKASPVGELYNEVPDRVSDIAVMLGLGYAAGGIPELGYAAAVLAVITAYVRAACKVAGAPQDYCGPMAKPHRMFLVTVTAMYLACVPEIWRWRVQENSWGIPAAVLLVVCLGCLVTAIRRLSHGAAALRGK